MNKKPKIRWEITFIDKENKFIVYTYKYNKNTFKSNRFSILSTILMVWYLQATIDTQLWKTYIYIGQHAQLLHLVKKPSVQIKYSSWNVVSFVYKISHWKGGKNLVGAALNKMAGEISACSL